MLTAFSTLVYAHNQAPSHLQTQVIGDMRRQSAGQKAASLRTSDSSRDLLRRRAEAAFSEAAGLHQRQTEKELQTAILLFRTSARLFKAANLNDKAAEANLQIGKIYFNLSQYDQALGSYQEARILGGKNPELLCIILSRIARIYATTGQNSAADRYSSQALNECSTLATPQFQAESFEARGEALYNAGKLSESVDFFNRAQALAAEAKDGNGQARALLMSAYAHFHSERGKALQFAGEALKLWSALGDLHGVAEARTALGIFAAATDEFETAQCNYKVSLPVFRSMGDKDNEASVLNGMGFASRATGDVEASLENYTRAKTVFMSVRDRIGTVEAITGIGKALHTMRQYRQLMPLYRMKLRLARQDGNIAQEASALADLAGIYELQHQYARAKKLYSSSLATYSTAKSDYGIGDIQLRLALLHVKQGEDSQAIVLLEKARILKDKTGQIGEVARIYYELALIHRRLNHLQEARAAIEKTIEIIESQRIKIASFDSRAVYFSSVHEYYALYIQILMLLDRENPEKGFGYLALEASEKSKVRALLDLFNASQEDSPCSELLERQLAPDSTKPQVAENKPAASAPPVLTSKQIQTEIGTDHTVLLEYELGDEKSYVWFVDSDRITAHELPRADEIRKLVRDFRGALTAREPLPGENNLKDYKERIRKADKAYPRLARRLARLLLDPVNLAGVKRFLIVPDGSLQYISFSALPLPDSGEKGALVMNHHEVVILPSASALSVLRKAAKERRQSTRTAIIIADPVVERDDRRVSFSARHSLNKKPQAQPPALQMALRDAEASQPLLRLKGSRKEAEAIQEILNVPDVLVALDFNASRDHVLQGQLEPYRIIHFATHGIIDARHPEMSGLILSVVNERGQPQDGYLRLGDIYKLRLSADLVVLSACNSALGKRLESEGIIGLPRGFLYAGGHSVIASLWKVDDEAGVDFMKGFYARIKRGESPSSALRGAQVEMSRGRRWPEPFYWAAFVLQGDFK